MHGTDALIHCGMHGTGALIRCATMHGTDPAALRGTQFLGSKNMYSIAQEKGLWKPGTPFDFTAIYSEGGPHSAIALRAPYQILGTDAVSRTNSPVLTPQLVPVPGRWY
eukprot:1832939-Rhodomonas_salina.2